MAAIGVQPIILKNYSLTVGTDDFAAAVPSLRLNPAQSLNTWKGGTAAAVFSDLTTPVWTCVMKLGADYDNPSSLWNYLWENQGATKAVTFKPNKKATGTSLQVAATLILAAPGIGGDIDAWAEETLSHAVIGQPVKSLV